MKLQILQLKLSLKREKCDGFSIANFYFSQDSISFSGSWIWKLFISAGYNTKFNRKIDNRCLKNIKPLLKSEIAQLSFDNSCKRNETPILNHHASLQKNEIFSRYYKLCFQSNEMPHECYKLLNHCYSEFSNVMFHISIGMFHISIGMFHISIGMIHISIGMKHISSALNHKFDVILHKAIVLLYNSCVSSYNIKDIFHNSGIMFHNTNVLPLNSDEVFYNSNELLQNSSRASCLLASVNQNSRSQKTKYHVR